MELLMKQKTCIQGQGGSILKKLIFASKKILWKSEAAKESLARVFSCDFCEISKSTFFAEHLWTTASGKCENKDLILRLLPDDLEKILFYKIYKSQFYYVILPLKFTKITDLS